MENLKIVPTNDAKLMKRDFISRMERAQMGPNSRLDTCMNEEATSPRAIIGVVLATTPQMPKSERESVLRNETKWPNGNQYPSRVSVMFVPYVGSVGGFIYVALDSSCCDWDCDVNVFLW